MPHGVPCGAWVCPVLALPAVTRTSCPSESPEGEGTGKNVPLLGGGRCLPSPSPEDSPATVQPERRDQRATGWPCRSSQRSGGPGGNSCI